MIFSWLPVSGGGGGGVVVVNVLCLVEFGNLPAPSCTPNPRPSPPLPFASDPLSWLPIWMPLRSLVTPPVWRLPTTNRSDASMYRIHGFFIFSPLSVERCLPNTCQSLQQHLSRVSAPLASQLPTASKRELPFRRIESSVAPWWRFRVRAGISHALTVLHRLLALLKWKIQSWETLPE